MTRDQIPDLASFLAESTARLDPWVSRLGPEAAASIAVVPQWSVDLLRSAGHRAAASRHEPEELRHALIRAGIATGRSQRSREGGSAAELFWLHDAVRLRWIEEARQSGVDVERLVEETASVLQRFDSAGGAVPTPTARWLELVGSPAGRSGPDLVHRVAGLVAADLLAEATALVDAASALAPVRAQDYAGAVERARRLPHLGHRRRRDRSALAGFVRRPEQIEPVLNLLASVPGEPWALHMLGPGGVGKTMLVRYLASGLLAGERLLPPFAVARVDFDHISPDYPSVRPVQLLRELADELVLHATAAVSDRARTAFVAAADQVDAAAADGPIPPGHFLVRQAVACFGDFLSLLPGPQVLVLDTCEELAKLHPAASEVPAVERTFQLLADVHKACPTLRVVLAGRRYLAAGGAGWELPAGVTERSVVSLARREFVSLTPLQGFDQDEARALLHAPHPVWDDSPSEAFVAAVLERSPDSGRTGSGEARYNPFLVAQYRAWWVDDPGIPLSALTDGGPDAYVEGRIAARLRDRQVEDLLPVLAVLGRLDEVMLALALPHGADLERAFELLAEQEWIDVSADEVSGLRVLSVSVGLLPLLQDWGSRPEQQGRTAAARLRLLGPLRQRLEAADLGRLTPELVAAALRSYAPGEAALAWARVEERVEAAGRWEWAGNLLRRVRAELEAECAADPLLDAALAATTLAAEWRRSPGATMSAQWGHVERLLGRAAARPASGGADAHVIAWRDRLVERARLGGMRERGGAAVQELLIRWGGSPADLFPSVVGALEAMLAPISGGERPELGVPALALNAANVARAGFGEASNVGDPGLLAAWLVALSTLVEPAEREPILAFATIWADAAVQQGDRRTWADRPLWDRRDPRVWVALHEAASVLTDVIRDAEDAPSEALAKWWTLAEGSAGIDADRLAGCVLELTPPDLDTAPGSDGTWLPPYDPAVRPVDAIHDETPACFVAVARAHYRAGRPAEAEKLLDLRRQEARSAGEEDVTVRGADEALAWLACRMRWPHYRPNLMAALREQGGAGAALANAHAVLVGDRQAPSPHAAHAALSAVPSWLSRNLGLELLLLYDRDELGLKGKLAWFVPSDDPLDARDPVTAAQSAALIDLHNRREVAAPPSRPGSNVPTNAAEACYRAIPPAARLPRWGSVGAGVEPGDPWAPWRVRWALLDGSYGSIDRETRELVAGPELRGPTPVGQRGVWGAARHRVASAMRAVGRAVSLAAGSGVAWYAMMLAIAALAGLYEGITGQTTGFLEESDDTGLVIAMGIAAVLTVLPAVPWIGWPVRRRVACAFVLALTVTPRSAVRVRLRSGMRHGTRGRFPLPLPSLWSPVRRATRSTVPPPLGRRALRLRRGEVAVPVVLDAEASAQSTDWEHILIDVGGAGDLWRCVWIRRGSSDRPLPRPAAEVAIHVPTAWAASVREAYGDALGPSVPGTPGRVPGGAGNVRVDHLMGLPVDTRSGPVLQITAGHEAERRQPKVHASTDAAAGAGVPVSSWLTVLQITPNDGPFRRDALTAEVTRRLALGVQRETGGWVLTLPALPTEVSAAVLRELGGFSRRRRYPRPWTVVSCTGRIKARIVRAGGGGEAAQAARDVAQDVLLIGPWGKP